jgi:hypothetical protein
MPLKVACIPISSPDVWLSSGDEMLTQMINAEKRETKIDRFVDEKLKREIRQYDESTDQSMNPRSIAIHNDQRSELLRKELEYLTSENLAAFKGLSKRKSLGRSRRLSRFDLKRSLRSEAKRFRDLSPISYERAGHEPVKKPSIFF